MKQNTIQKEISFSGIGLHSAVKTTITIKPAPVDTGIIFRRIDVKKANEIPALYSNVGNATLGTTITNKIVEVQTIEHLMAALWCCAIDNAYIEYDNKETPIMDGSAYQFIKEIESAGVQEQDANRKFLVIKKEIEIMDGKKKIVAKPNDAFKTTIEVEYDYGGIGKQVYDFNGDKNIFIKDVALARTFCNYTEIENMKKLGFALGGFADMNLDDVNKNTDTKIPFFLKLFSFLKKKPEQQEYDLLQEQFKKGEIVENAAVYDGEKILNKSGVRCENEVAKHKMLDLLGDLYTSGYNIKGEINAKWSGHAFHNKFLHLLFADKNNYVIEE